ncbi:DUF262 domain-containing protein [Coleofasciculus sp. F4-SAH-05]|uniref:DUF262 domain-containing protein n=1 Tax=Coleofasciculus sp. F4-SAH-05 TaxID=3069525 RepID=UPI0032F0A1A8
MMNRAINFQTVSWFWDLYTRKLLDLAPPYQRRSVWNQDYKDFFIDTVLNNYPAPAIFLYQDITAEGISRYSVVDGKQRLSTLFEFAENQFPVSETATITNLRGKYFKDLDTEVKQNFWKYQFAVEYVPSSDEAIINNIFDRINRNVSKLTPQELRHAKFNGVFINAVEDLTQWMSCVIPPNFPSINTKSRKQMKDVELVAQLLLFLEEGVKSYRQEDLDKAFSDREFNWDDQDEIENYFKEVIQLIKQLIEQSPQNIDLRKTRLKNQTDFYSIFAAISELKRDNYNFSGKIPEVSKKINDFLQIVNSPEERINIPEAQDYYDAITTSPLYSTVEKTKTRINILKSLIQGNINLKLFN